MSNEAEKRAPRFAATAIVAGVVIGLVVGFIVNWTAGGVTALVLDVALFTALRRRSS